MCENTLFECSRTDYFKLLAWTSSVESVKSQNYHLNEKEFCKNTLFEELETIVRFLRKQWIFIQNLVLLDDNSQSYDIKNARKCLNEGLNAILEYIHRNSTCHSELLNAVNSLSVSVLPLDSFDEKCIMKLCNVARTKEKCQLFEYFHAYLEIRMYVLFVQFKICDSVENEFVDKVIRDFVILSRKLFLKESNIDQTPFLCECLANFWKILQSVLCDKFWIEIEIVLKNDDDLFSLWMIKNLILISQFGTLPNYNLIKEKLKNSLGYNDDILKHIKLVHGVLYKLNSENRVETLLLLWEYFGKRLNVLCKNNSTSFKNCGEFIEHLDLISYSIYDCTDEYDYFTGILIEYLKKNPNHWGKIKCRIFSQLSPFKIKDLSEIGFYKVAQLFISLMQIYPEELSGKLISIFKNVHEDKITTTHINTYTSLIIVHVRKNEDVEKLCPFLCKILQDASEKQRFNLIKEFLNGFELIINTSACLNLHQWTLLDTWIIKYMSTCYFQDLEKTLGILRKLIIKLKCEDSFSSWKNVFIKFIHPVIKQIGVTTSCPVSLGELGGELFNLNMLQEDIYIFFNSENVPPKVTEKFLCTILKNYPDNFKVVWEKQAVQSWIKICLFSTKNYEDITTNVMKLKIIPGFINKETLSSSKDPYIAFIEILSSNIKAQNLHKFTESSYENLEKTLTFFLGTKTEDVVILRIYTCLALTFLNCGILLYDRHKISSPLTKLISCLLFPSEFLTSGKTSHQFLTTIKKTWHIFFEALIKLDPDNNDTYIQRTIRDLISKYLPVYTANDSPIFSCLNRENSAKIILNKLSSIYFKHPSKEHENNVIKALKILKEFIESNTSLPLFKIVIEQTLYGLCEVYIFQPVKNLSLAIIISIFTNNFYEKCKNDVLKILNVLTEKHVAFNSKNYFNLIYISAKTIPGEILILKGNIIEKIKEIERIRGIGYDNTLRNYLSVLSDILNK